jgi:periplasmic divalent cation tolerance protein
LLPLQLWLNAAPENLAKLKRRGGLNQMTDARIVLTTVSSPQEAEKIARALVERRLAACVNIVSQIQSVYRWKDKVEQETEWLLIIKTRISAFESVREAIKELHSYELPECIMLEVSSGSEAYLNWIEENTR